ncbi:LuxR C-terminal-related transcriptional regulator [Paenibacillus sp. CECT 9249]|uniref:LuxR C-terminal-related transcriptional regulator n=1 Tax=Paenibacillus sp. CECT 9249 TaxID=2845385 RepID=UPI001E617EBE|nr:LuxR C-terminal-related transcriptional regulator [Paenibacillus sp. CECT 9249]
MSNPFLYTIYSVAPSTASQDSVTLRSETPVAARPPGRGTISAAAQSLHMLERALALAEPEGYIRSFVDEGKPLRKLLASYLKSRQSNHRRGNRNVSLSYVKRLLRSIYNSRLLTELAEMKEHHFDSLTAQETNVLQLIHAGLTNQEIASRLQVSLSTVKTHINNLYRKLHVDNRILAVQRAKQLELL